MSIVSVVSVLHSLVGLFLLWVLVFYCWRDYRVDALRQNLFVLRDELFDLASSGAIAFNDPAYGRLRVATNSFIRFAHKLTYSRLLMGRVAGRFVSYPEAERPFNKLMDAIAAVPDPETRDRLTSIHSRILWAVTRHILTGSPFLALEFLLFILPSVLSAQVKLKTPASGIDRLEDQAIESEEPGVALQPA